MTLLYSECPFLLSKKFFGRQSQVRNSDAIILKKGRKKKKEKKKEKKKRGEKKNKKKRKEL